MLSIYSVFDEKSGTFNTPIFALSDGVLIRDFRSFLRERSSTLSQYPEDYTLYRIGVFFEDEGAIESCSPTPVISMLDILKMDISPESESKDE